jgi:O-antigen ligase
MVANEFDQLLGKKLSRYIQKPLWDCIACMGSFWTLIICLFNQEHPGMTIRLVFIVTAINAIIDKYLDYES